ncbi:MAG: phage tail protein I [Sporomusaceae bacterium]|nr:phage tail protein I [Sporomusaceae bacterium]
MAKLLQSVKMADILPPNLLGDENVQAIAEAIDAEMQLLIADINQGLHLPRLNELVEAVVALLAWQWHVDFYDSTLPIAKKRELVRQSIAWHRRKGTPGVVQEMVSTVLSSGVVSEWFEYGGDPYKFKVETDEIITDETVYDRLFSLVFAVKNERSWLESVTVRRTWSGAVYFGAAQVFGKNLTLYPVAFTMEAVTGPTYFGSALHSGKILSLEVS